MATAHDLLTRQLLEWASCRPPLIAIAAMEIAAAAPAAHELLVDMARGRGLWKVLGEGDQYRNQLYYQDRYALAADLGDAMRLGDAGDLRARLQWLEPERMKWLIKWSLTPFDLPAFRRGVRIGKRYWANLLRKQAKRIACGGSDIFNDPFLVAGFLQRPAGVYFFTVAVPCLLLYGELPWRLFARATRQPQPDLQALKRLVQLDPGILTHPGLDPVLYSDDRRRLPRRWDIVGKALGTLPRLPNQRQVTRRLAALVPKLARGLGTQMYPREVQQLFDLVSRAPHPVTGAARPEWNVDEHLPAGDALRKALAYYGRDWKVPGPPDKKTQEAVRALTTWAA